MQTYIVNFKNDEQMRAVYKVLKTHVIASREISVVVDTQRLLMKLDTEINQTDLEKIIGLADVGDFKLIPFGHENESI